MNTRFWNKLFELIRILIRAPYRTKADAERLEKILDELKVEVHNGNENP
jgi:hypothetical protein